MPKYSDRRIALKILLRFDRAHIPLEKIFEESSVQSSFIKSLCYGVIRWYFQLDFILHYILKKPLPSKEKEIYWLILLGLYQLLYTHIPHHAILFETVETARQMKKNWATSFINAVLRTFMKKRLDILDDIHRFDTAKYAHPQWMIESFQRDWPHHFEEILKANNRHPPMTLRINRLMTTPQSYEQQNDLHLKSHPHCSMALTLEKPLPIGQLPGFSAGHVSIQDSSAQLAAELLDLHPHHSVLDACAAPGGKTTHMLEMEPNLQKVLAIDQHPKRLQKIQENLDRLHLNAQLITANATDPQTFWDGTYFDRILLDAPCSATGVIRRHPDIKLLRKSDEIPLFAKKQYQLLQSLWPLLKSQGKLVYATCSLLREENQHVITRFLSDHPDAFLQPIHATWGSALTIGRQILPGQDDMDGFYYAVLLKREQ